TVGASDRGGRLMGLDGTTLDLPDTPVNARAFGRPTTGRAEGAFPPVRLLALGELGTHAVCGLALKPLGHGEPSMVGPLPDHLGAGERHRLITDLTNPEDMPAHEAPRVDHERWEEELAFDEIKTHLNDRAMPIRSKTPAGVVPEIDGLMRAHDVVRRVMHD